MALLALTVSPAPAPACGFHEGSVAEGLPPIAVVLVEARLWGRAASGPGGPRFAEHVPAVLRETIAE